MDFKDLLEDALEETGVQLKLSADELAVEVALGARALALSIDEPGFPRIVRSVRNVIALKAGIEAMENADALESRIVGIIQGTLFNLAGRLA